MGYRQESNGDNTTRSITGIVVMVVFFIGLFIIARFVLKLLYWLSPLLFIGAIILDYKTVVGYGQWLVNLVKRNTGMGILAIVGSLIFFPFVSAYLLGKAYLSKKSKDIQEEQRRHREGDLIDYEEMDSRPLEFPEMERRRRSSEEDDLLV
ncbi:MAG: hypothetical protein HUU01_01550 [Saprospiraceae bacterium]|nr:hypothetical protein [Saprospiraceae bacterium]